MVELFDQVFTCIDGGEVYHYWELLQTIGQTLDYNRVIIGHKGCVKGKGPFFWYDNEFSEKNNNKKNSKSSKKLVSYQKKGERLSFFWYDTNSGH